MFSSGPFSSQGFSVSESAIPSGITGGNVLIYFNNYYLTFPLEINTLADLTLDINTSQDHSLGINTETDLALDINTQQDHSLDVNRTLDFSAER